jgi:hypothetical protein
LHIVRELCGKKIHWLGRVGSFPFFPVQARGFC